MLHRDYVEKSSSSASEESRSEEINSQEVVATHASHPATTSSIVAKSALLGTALVTLAGSHGNQLKVIRASTSQPVAKDKQSVGAAVTSVSHKEAALYIRSDKNKDFVLCVSAFVLDKLTGVLPRRKIDYPQWNHIQNLTLADPAFCKPDKVDCLLGADVYSEIMLPGLIKGLPGSPLAQQTVFGWILTGTMPSLTPSAHATIRVFHTYTENSLDNLLQKFWEVQESLRQKHLTQEERECEDYFESTVERDSTGRYVVRLPFKQQHSFSGSREAAVACLHRTNRRLQGNTKLASMYKDYIKDYMEQGHMEIVPLPQLPRESYYVPHHAVARHGSFDKIRLVFNASQKDRRKISLNDILSPGPKTQTDITTIILRWRFFEWVYTSDIKQMFRQILVHEEDRDWQRIVWQEDSSQPIQDLRVKTVVQGTASAPFLANKVIKHLAKNGQETQPLAAEILDEQIYVDDIFGGADNKEVAINQRNQLIQLLQSAGMSLSKWSSNDPDILKGVLDSGVTEVPVGDEAMVSTLGIKWLPDSDVFSMKFSFNKLNQITKRTILSEIAKLYDPLGWIAPLIAIAKMILQDLWLEKVEWDELVNSNFQARWTSFYNSLEDLNQIKLPCWIEISTVEKWTLHGFADASKRVYAAVIYAVLPGKSSRILISKTKLAPTSVQTTPRLELCAAELLAKLTKALVSSIKNTPSEIHFWSDSKVVLDWLKGHPSRWPTFVANRVSTITSLFPGVKWKYVRSGENSADCATRGLTPLQLKEHEIWWEGPKWILQKQISGDQNLQDEEGLLALHAEETETRRTNTSSSTHSILDSLQNVSNFQKIHRILAYIARWRIISSSAKEDYQERRKRRDEISKIQKNPEAERPAIPYLDEQERAMAIVFCFRALQIKHFSKELKLIKEGKTLYKRSNIARCAPFIDEKNCLRVGGRLELAQLPHDERHPIILPGNDSIVRSYVREVHLLTLHGGPKLMLSVLYRQVWITQAPIIVQTITRSCVKCARYAAKTGAQQMGQLPTTRVTPQRPFSIAGLDYAGPFHTLISKGRGAKKIRSYIAIFVCFVTKAVHVEIVSDLTTTAFLAAYARFTARRGVCRQLYSDNATTFKGAAKELQQLFEESSEFVQQVRGQLAMQRTDWSSIPPRAPHFGGLWEAAVKRFKRHFVKIVGESTFSFEEITTLAAKIEACLNSRPLSPLSTDTSEPAALTPAHFLIGTPCLAPPEAIDLDERISLSNRWRLITQLRNSFWARWRKEVLHHLQQRSKWINPLPNFKTGDLVILKDELTPPATWPLGIVTRVFPGKDKLVRSVEVKTANSIFVRPIIKLIRLPTEEESEDGNKKSEKAPINDD